MKTLRPGIVVLLALFAAAAAAETRTGAWSTSGPYGAWITAFAFEPATRTLFAGTLGSGIFSSSDGARTWSELPRSPYHATVTAIAADPSDRNVLVYAAQDQKPSRTADGGRTWQEPTGIAGYLWTLAYEPGTPGVLWASGDEGIFVSPDSGRTFRTSLSSAKAGTVMSLAFDGSGRGRVWAAGNKGLFRTKDGGTTWDVVPEAGTRMRYVAVDPKTPTFVAALGSDALLVSKDSGATWLRHPQALARGMTSLVIDPGLPRRLLALGSGGPIVSTDDGASWEATNPGSESPEIVGALMKDPFERGTFYAATQTGVVKSADGGASWTAANHGLAGLWVNAVALDARTGTTVYAATRWGRFRSLDSGKTWQRIDRRVNQVSGIAIDPAAPDSLYSATPADDRDLVGPMLLKGRVLAGFLEDRRGDAPEQGYTCVVVDPQDPTLVWAGSVRGVRRSADAGRTWPSAGLENEAISALAVDSRDGSVAWAGSRKGALFRTSNGGQDWSAAALDVKGTEIAAVALPGGAPGTVYVATHGRGLHRSRDGGASFVKVAGLPYQHLRAVTATADGRILLVGTNGKGVYASEDGGETWRESNEGLTGLSVTSIAGDPKTGLVVVGTTKGVFVRSAR